MVNMDLASMRQKKAISLRLKIDLETWRALRAAGVQDVMAAEKQIKNDLRWPQFVLGDGDEVRTAQGVTVADVVAELLSETDTHGRFTSRNGTVIPMPRRVVNPWLTGKLAQQLDLIATDSAAAARLCAEAGGNPWWH